MPANQKIIDIISQDNCGKPFVSLEYFPPRTEEGVQNLYSRMDRMKATLNPAFTDMTWGAGGSTADLSLQIAKYAHKTGHVANLHMTCTNLGGDNVDPQAAILGALQEAYDAGIRNIVALRGDPPAGQAEWKAAEGGFSCGLDLVKFIRSKFGDEYGVSVAGYPEGHPNSITEIADPASLTPSEQARSSSSDGKTYTCLDADYKLEMDYLKAKVDAGAELIITQMFFDSQVFATFVKDCRSWGITCPVVPGIMCINNYTGFVKMTKFCKTRVPMDVAQKMESIKDDVAAMKQYGIDFGAQMVEDLLATGEVQVLHFYTLNLERVVYGVLDKIGVTDNALATVDEGDAAVQVAKGSAWARVGDRVKTLYGAGTVLEVSQDSGAAKVQIETWTMAESQNPIAYLSKGHYEKIF